MTLTCTRPPVTPLHCVAHRTINGNPLRLLHETLGIELKATAPPLPHEKAVYACAHSPLRACVPCNGSGGASVAPYILVRCGQLRAACPGAPHLQQICCAPPVFFGHCLQMWVVSPQPQQARCPASPVATDAHCSLSACQ